MSRRTYFDYSDEFLAESESDSDYTDSEVEDTFDYYWNKEIHLVYFNADEITDKINDDDEIVLEENNDSKDPNAVNIMVLEKDGTKRHVARVSPLFTRGVRVLMETGSKIEITHRYGDCIRMRMLRKLSTPDQEYLDKYNLPKSGQIKRSRLRHNWARKTWN